jgi:hypothetical protein
VRAVNLLGQIDPSPAQYHWTSQTDFWTATATDTYMPGKAEHVAVWTGIKMLFATEISVDPDRNPVVRLFRQLVPVTTEPQGQRFLVRIAGKIHATPLLLALALSPLLEGCARKLRAMIHSRIGPPIIQPYYDLLKLVGKEDIQPKGMYFARMVPWICFGTIATAALLVPMGTIRAPFGAFGDSILFSGVHLFNQIVIPLINYVSS